MKSNMTKNMPKSSIKKIDEDKQKVLELIISDSRQSPNEIAQKLGFSRQKAWKIIKLLEKENRVWGYTAIAPEYKKGWITYFALVKIKYSYLKEIKMLIENIKKGGTTDIDLRVIGVFFTNGCYDGIIIFSVRNIQNAKKYLGHMQKMYGDQVERIDLIENVFPLIISGKLNPDIDKLKDFSIE